MPDIEFNGIDNPIPAFAGIGLSISRELSFQRKLEPT